MSFLDTLKQLFSGNANALPIIDVEARFELLGRTGQGSMSKVWRARDRDSGRTVCLKILDRIKTEKFEGRFAGLKKPSEGEICKLLKHENIVQTYEYGLTTEKEPYIIMELVDGVGLSFLIETKHQQLEGKRIEFLNQLAVGLDYMHKTGYLHRDLCPRNVMVTEEDVIKIIDLGLTIPYTPAFCKPGNRTGSTMYLAPEIIRRASTDHRVDLFALGVTAYEVFTGDTPWEKGESQKVLRAIVNNPPREPRELRENVDEETAKFLVKAVDRNPGRRFQDTDEFRAALAKLPKQ